MKCETVDLEVPAHAEIILEGYVELGELRAEGPFGDHTGFYTLEDEYPVFHLTCITHRKDPIYAATIVGKPPMEDAWMGKAVERIFLPAMKMTIPELVDIHLPVEAVFHNLMIVSIKKSYPGQARKVMNAIWSLGQAMFTKCIIVVDEDCDVQNIRRGGAARGQQHRSRARHSVHARPRRFARPREPPAQLRIEDGDRRHAQVEGRRLRSPVAGDDRDGPRDEGQGRRDVGEAGAVARIVC